MAAKWRANEIMASAVAKIMAKWRQQSVKSWHRAGAKRIMFHQRNNGMAASSQ